MKESKVLVSVIVPIYNTETYLPTCIESIRAQTHKNIQIILVDDQSPDKCPEICENYAKKDSRITVIHQKNKGVSAARNTGLHHAVGEYVFFVDSDDEVSEDALSILLKDAFDYNADIVWAPNRRIEKTKNLKGIEIGEEYTIFQGESTLLLSLNLENNINAVWSKLFKRKFIEGLCFEEGKNINEDGFFMFQCYMRKPILVRHNISIYRYNIRTNSSSRQHFSDKYLSMIYFCEKKKELIATYYPQYIGKIRDVEIFTHLQLLDILCSSIDKKHKELEKSSVKKVCELYVGHKPFNKHYKLLAWIVKHGLYSFYKKAIRIKYYS